MPEQLNPVMHFQIHSWCFAGGSPGVLERTVNFNEGVNQIEITPSDGTATFIDQVKLKKSIKALGIKIAAVPLGLRLTLSIR